MMEFWGYKPTAAELAAFSVAVGLAVATASLLLNLVWEAFKHCTGRFTPHGIRRCAACMNPAESGSYLCARHAELNSIIRRRRTDRAA